MTTTDDIYGLAHLVELVHDTRPGGLGARAVCSCGWAGDWRDDTATAIDDGTDHSEIEVGPPDPMDGLMSGLLDLQDDLAEVVMWLAEHWSADLPVPNHYGTGDPAAVVLLTCIPDDATLTRAARLLGVELVDDPAPDSSGTRYRRAVRRFGRVSVHAYRRLDARCQECGTTYTDVLCPSCRGRRRGERIEAA